MRPLSTYWTPGLRFRGIADAGSVMILVIRSVRPSSDPPSLGKGESAAAEAKAATRETEGRERNIKSYRIVGKGRVTCLADHRVICRLCRQVVVVEVKFEARVRAEAEVKAKAKMLERRVQLYA